LRISKGEQVFQIFQTLGALFGVLSAAFVVWDRLVSQFPTAIMIGAPLGGFGQRASYLRITNRSDRPILLWFDTTDDASQFRIAIDHSARSIISSVMRGTTIFTLDPKEERDFPVINSPNFVETHIDSQIEARLRWRFAQPILWRAERRLVVSITKRDYLALIDGTTYQHVDD
jgi:hypothetical protein